MLPTSNKNTINKLKQLSFRHTLKLATIYIHIPYLPCLHHPGWLIKILLGAHDWELFESYLCDIWAGITVTVILIPQEAVNFAACAALSVGLIMTVMSLLNLGNFVRFIAHPVMSGFTTGAAMLIGLNQLKSACGFLVTVPQQGQPGVQYNYQVLQWYIDNWNGKFSYSDEEIANNSTYASYNNHSYRNPYAMKICFAIYVSLTLINLFKSSIDITAELKKSIFFRCFNICCNLLPLAALIIAGHVAYQIKKQDHFNSPSYVHDLYSHKLKIIGIMKSDMNFIKVPSFKWNFFQLLSDVLPLTFIGFMESYSVAHRIAIQTNSLHLINASQELWANGVSNFLSGLSSSFPLAGSFSRSSQNATAGAKTPLSMLTTLFSMLIVLKYLTKALEFIPFAALAAIVFVAISSLIRFSDFWETYKHSKKDFITMIATMLCVFIFNTITGLVCGLIISSFWLFFDTAFNSLNAPSTYSERNRMMKSTRHFPSFEIAKETCDDVEALEQASDDSNNTKIENHIKINNDYSIFHQNNGSIIL
eukprot:gene5586-7711_t